MCDDLVLPSVGLASEFEAVGSVEEAVQNALCKVCILKDVPPGRGLFVACDNQGSRPYDGILSVHHVEQDCSLLLCKAGLVDVVYDEAL